MGDPNKTNQNVYRNNQKFEIDIKKTYYRYIDPNKLNTQDNPSTQIQSDVRAPKPKGIDDYRSKISVVTKHHKELATAVMENALPSILAPSDTYQESRCHAFYRLIGFPVYDGNNFYNPGLDHITENPEGGKKAISSEIKRKTASNCMNDASFIKLSNAREAIPTDSIKTFNDNTSINASVLALSSSTRIRKFASSVENINADPLSKDPVRQTYRIDPTGQVGNYKPSLYEYMGPGGNTPTVSLSERQHIIVPFLVDPRYSESVNEENKVGVPFASPSKLQLNVPKQLEAAPGVYVSPPMLQIIIENRLSDKNKTGSSDQLNIIKSALEGLPSIKDEALVKQVSSETNYKLTEQQQFLQFINIIQAMMTELVKAQNRIEKTQKLYYWIPIPSQNGPEYGVSVRPFTIFKELAEKKQFMTPLDYDILVHSIKQFSAQIASSTSYDTAKNLPVFPGAANMFNPDVNSDCGDKNEKALKNLLSQREQEMKEAGEALQIIEMILGEFSGLGLCDMLAIEASLYLISKESLLGFLDEDAFLRMKSVLKINNIQRNEDLTVCLQELTNTVTQFYNLMDKLYIDTKQYDNRT